MFTKGRLQHTMFRLVNGAAVYIFPLHATQTWHILTNGFTISECEIMFENMAALFI